jgi:LDH2 family malate/lactate/ureidoglycolate dehydrogenase
MAVIAELIGESILGVPREHNWLIIALDFSAFCAADDYLRSCEAFVDKIHSIPAAPGFKEVLAPGELESQIESERRERGIPVPDGVWKTIVCSAKAVGVDVEQFA